MIKLDVTASPFIIEVPTTESNQWMNDHVGEIISDKTIRSFGHGWKIYMVDNPKQEDHGRWFVEFDSEEHASWFTLRWL